MSPETVRRWADAGRLPMERDGSGNRMIDCVGLALFAGRAGGRRRAGRRARAAVLRAQRLHRIVTALTVGSPR
ncbi:hypothetical protein [Streptomyces sp. TR1341]|uniref:hypothetical protein n=1 Tax=Streptomyces sp. TR1341 TaxID=2601266 RepID=UPI0030840CD4